MLPLLGLDTGPKYNDQELRERKEAREKAKALQKRQKAQDESNAISKARRSLKRSLRRGVRLDINGPIPLGRERDVYVDQIFEDLNSICDEQINEVYLRRNLFRSFSDGSPIPMGYPGNPFLWVITDRHVGVDRDDEEYDQLVAETVFGFAIATRLTYESEGNRSMFDLKLICSQRGMGVDLFKHILRFANDRQGNPESLFANVFTLEPINRTVSQLYEDAAQEVLGRPLQYMADGHLLVVLNDNEAVRGIYNDRTISREDFYVKIG
jgi:hypothetical protein